MSKKYRVSLDGALTMAMELHKHGQLREAESVYMDVLNVEPGQPDALHLLGVALHQLGDTDRGIEYLLRSLEHAPGNPSAINNLGNIYRESGRLQEALDTYLKVLEIEPRHADTLVNLGNILRRQGKFDEALKMLESAIEISPDHAQAHHNIGIVYEKLNRPEDALKSLSRAHELAPHDDKASLSMASTLYECGRHEEALKAIEQVLSLKPDHAIALHMQAAFSGKDIPPRASDGYVRQLFDDFSASFDESLARLDYRGPKLVGEFVERTLGPGKESCRILDIGCGTGLCGPMLKPYAEYLAGVDLSPRMLKKAEARKVYDRLEEAELTAYMQQTKEKFDFIVCADTFVYFGELSEALQAAAAILSAGGSLLFTVEAMEADAGDAGYRLEHHGRYCHSRRYLEDRLAVAGLAVSSLQDVMLRRESGKSVDGYMVFARKP